MSSRAGSTRETQRERVLFGVLAVASLLVLIAGFRAYAFVCDDAFIAFRYVSNSRLGYGYVWNPPPFRPVEGYTSFLWVLLLDATWRLTSLAPPQAVLGWSFVCALGQLACVLAFARRWFRDTRFTTHRFWLAALLVLGTVTNRTFLVWTSSGLETPLFSWLVLTFLYLALFRALDAATLCAVSCLATLLALCRPDGWLFVLVTLGLWAVALRSRQIGLGRGLSALSPLAIVIAHLAWRRAYYGFFWPNSYYAKHVAAWPSAGGVYLASFSLEYALYIWWILLVSAAFYALRSGWPARTLRALGAGDVEVSRALLVIGAIAVHAGYYTFVIGGDHFEYRIYAPWIALILLSFLRLAEWVGWSARKTSYTLSATLMLGLAIPWYHYAVTLRVHERGHSFVALAPTISAQPVHSYLAVFDHLQSYLAAHMIGSRHHAHRIFARDYQASLFPTRERGERIRGKHPVLVYGAVGVPGWVLPHVAIVDRLGLNDVVVARSAPRNRDSAARRMAHDRAAPAEYVACFSPNVRVLGAGRVTIDARPHALKDEDIVACETKWWQQVGAL